VPEPHGDRDEKVGFLVGENRDHAGKLGFALAWRL